MEDNPDVPYECVKQAIIAKAEREAEKLESYDFGSRYQFSTNPHLQQSR